MNRFVIFVFFAMLIVGLATGVRADLEPRLGGLAVYDTIRDITYLADPNLPLTIRFDFGPYEIDPATGEMDWGTATRYIDEMNNMNAGQGHLGCNTWRLPVADPGCVGTGCSNSDLGHLFYHQDALGGTAQQDICPAGNSSLWLFCPYPSCCIPQGGAEYYWTGTNAPNPPYSDNDAWAFSFSGGVQHVRYKYFPNAHHVWPVTDGDIAGGIDLVVEKMSDPYQVNADYHLTYNITVTNNGANDATGVVLTDTLPEGVDIVPPFPSGCLGDVVGTRIRVTCDIGTLASGDSAQVDILARAPSFPGIIINTVSMTSNENPTPILASVENEVVPAIADLFIEKYGPDELEVGQGGAYSIYVTNNGPGLATGVTVTDPLPEDMFYGLAEPLDDCTYHPTTHTVTCELDDLHYGTSNLVVISVTPNRDGLIENTASVSANESDPDETDNSATKVINVVLPAGMDVTITDSVNTPDDQLLDFGPVPVGEEVFGTVAITNGGTTELPIGGPVLDPLPPPFSIINPGNCFGSTLAAEGGSCSMIIRFAPRESGDFAEGFDLELGSLLASVDVSGTGELITQAAHLELTKEADNADLEVGDIVTFTITVRNVTGVDAAVEVVDVLPAPLQIAADPGVTSSRGDYDPATGIWDVGVLVAGEPAEWLEIPAEVTRDAPGNRCSVKNTATAEITTPGVEHRGVRTKSETVGIGGCADVAVVDILQEFKDVTLPSSLPQGFHIEEEIKFGPGGRACQGQGGCWLGFPEALPYELWVGEVYRECNHWNRHNPVWITDLALEAGSSSAFLVPSLSDPIELPLCEPNDKRHKLFEVEFRSSVPGSEHQGVLDIRHTDPNEGVIRLYLNGSVAPDFGGVTWTVVLDNEGPSRFSGPFRLEFDLPEGARFAYLETSEDISVGTEHFGNLAYNMYANSECVSGFLRDLRERVTCLISPAPGTSYGCFDSGCALQVKARVTGTSFTGGVQATFCSSTPDPRPNNNGPEGRRICP